MSWLFLALQTEKNEMQKEQNGLESESKFAVWYLLCSV